jgi:glycosyltransferase involved in cell wall biosynthesis
VSGRRPKALSGQRRMSSELRLLLVTPRFPPELGGTEIHTAEIAKRLAASGVRVTVLAADRTGSVRSRDQVLDPGWRDTVRVIRVRAWPSHRDYYFAPAMYRLITRGEWDIVHIHSYHTLVAPLAMGAAFRAGLPYLLTFHGGGHSSSFRDRLRSLQLALLRPLLMRADRLIVNSQFEAGFYAHHLNLPPSEFVVVPNGSDLPRAPATQLPPKDPNLIASVGRLERYKGHHRVLKALPHVLEHRPQIRLWIAGAGPYERELLKLARRLGVGEHVEIRPITAGQRDHMAHELSRAALVVLLSEFESNCMTVLEAAGLGLSVLVADQTGLAELAQDGLARAIPLQSTPHEIASAILHQLDNPHSPSPATIPTWDEVTERLLRVYDGVLNARSSPA